jgi:hypothetical protein
MPGVCFKSRLIVMPACHQIIASHDSDPNRTYWRSPPKRILDLDWADVISPSVDVSLQ